MIRVKSPLVQQMLAGITLVLLLGALSMIWPIIFTLFLGVLLLLQSCSAEQEIVALSWTEIGKLSTLVGSLRRPGPAIL